MIEDDQAERVVLLRLLDEHPALVSIDELSHELGDPIAARDAVARLARASVIHRHGAFVAATLATKRVDALLGRPI